jgi:5-methylthioadenosine/S-adenosylhomocysteine deaminase
VEQLEGVSSLLIRGGTIVTMNDAMDVFAGDVSIRDGRIAALGAAIDGPHDRIVDAGGGLVLPGFIQTHIHLCQTIFRGSADDLRLMDWLRTRVWPLEAAHTPTTLAASARLAAAELLSSGTTAVLTMETVHDTDAIFEAIEQTGLRATIGKCLMDASDGTPPRLRESAGAALDESLAISRRWHGAASGRLRAAFAPRFAVSCTRGLLESVAALSSEHGTLVHTHTAESLEEIAIVKNLSGQTNVEYLASLGLTSPRLCAAHCVWVNAREQELLAEHDVKVLHCPSSNLKLGSGVAPIAAMRARGITVSLGADGAACNNHLDMFEEMRLAAGLQSLKEGPGVLVARDVVWMATRAGARALGQESEIGSLEVGKRADLIVVSRDAPHAVPGDDPYSTLVYASRGSDVRTTVVDGELLVDEWELTRIDPASAVREARDAAAELLSQL